MSKVSELLRSKTWMQYVAYIACIVGIVVDIVFIAVDFGDYTFNMGCFVLVLVGSVCGLLDLVFDFDNLLLCGAAFIYAVAIGFHLSVALPSISDLWNGVNFIGGNQTVAIVFGCLFIAIEVVLIMANFWDANKKRI